MWSACECVNRIASTRRTSLTSACVRRSVEGSTRIDRTARAKAGCALSSSGCSSSRIDGRVRRSFGSVERQTAQSHPIDGTPCDVPLPSTVTSRLNNPLSAAGRFDEAQAKLVEHRLEHLTFFGGEVALGLLLEERENLDHLRGAFEVRLARLARRGIGQIAEVNRRAAGERDHERGERQSRRRHRYRVSNPIATEERHEPPRSRVGPKWIGSFNRVTLSGMVRYALMLCACLLVARMGSPCSLVIDDAHPRPTARSDDAGRLALLLTGTLVDADNFDPLPVPYGSVRPTGLSGACFTYDYRVGSTCLLLLKQSRTGALTPYWAALQPVNEQLRGDGDPWLLWVREEVAAK